MATRTGTYYTGTIRGQNGTLITVLDSILVTGEGWAKEFTGTNVAIYRPPTGNRFRMRVLDNGSTSAGAAREALVRPSEGATNVNTQIDPFPATTYWTNAECCWRKSDTADATDRDWWAVADDRFIIIYIRFSATDGNLYWFGDLEPYWTGDAYATSFLHNGANNSTSAVVGLISSITNNYSEAINTRVHFARRADGLLKFVNGAVVSANNTLLFGSYSSGIAVQYPHQSTNKFHMRPVVVNGIESQAFSGNVSDQSFPRAVVPFLFEPFHGVTFTGMAHGDTFTATAYDASSEFIVLSSVSDLPTTASRIVLQTAGTWTPGF